MGSATTDGCINWNSEKNKNYPWSNYKDRVKDTSDGDHNYCRMSTDSGKPWCATGESPFYAYCTIPQCQGKFFILFFAFKYKRLLK